jgi:DNA-binding NarL/FixJ family response regulator
MTGIRSKPEGTPAADAPVGQRSRILIVDDHPIVRQGLAQFINGDPALIVSGEAGDAQEAMAAIAAQVPDLVIADLSLRDRPGLELIKDIEAAYPKLPTLVLSMHDELLWAERVIRAGARGYIMKHEATDKVLEAIHKVLEGEIWVSEAVAGRLLRKFAKNPTATPDSPVAALSDRELVVFQLIGLGLGVRDIAERLSVSVKTVEAHREHIKDKLHLKSSVELLRYAVIYALDDR